MFESHQGHHVYVVNCCMGNYVNNTGRAFDPDAHDLDGIIIAARNIMTGINWSKTKQGAEYWEDIYNALRRLEKDVRENGVSLDDGQSVRLEINVKAARKMEHRDVVAMVDRINMMVDNYGALESFNIDVVPKKNSI